MKTGKPQKHGLDPDRLQRIAPWMDSYVAARKFPGSSMLLARGGREVFHYTTGHRDVENQLPFTRDTIARIYSMTKPITSVAVMMLAERGLFHLDAPVSEFIPAFAAMRALVPGAANIDQTEPCATPTLHQLLTHTAGLSYMFNPGLLGQAMTEQKAEFRPDRGPLEGMADLVASLPLAFHPGSRWEYSVAIDILGRVVEVVSGQTLAEFFQENIFDPLGMKETGFSVPKRAIDRFASLYTPLAGNEMAINSQEKSDETLRLADQAAGSAYLNASTYSGGSGLVGSIDDYMRFIEMLRCGGARKGHRLLSPKTLDFMMRNHLPGDIASMGPTSFAEQPMTGMGFGLGGSVILDPARTRAAGSVGDFSWGGMGSTYFWIDRKHDLSAVFFTQLSPSSSYPARPQLKALVHGALIK
jgi:CubicO group peptidase (beta-lactamase class C family)